MAENTQILLKLDALHAKVKILIDELKKENLKIKQLETDNLNLKNKLKIQGQNVKNENKNSINTKKYFAMSENFTKLAVNYGNMPGEAPSLKVLLEKYIEEIEGCITQLSN